MKKDSEKGIGSAEVDEITKDEELLASPEPEKPQPPGQFDERQVRKMVSAKTNLLEVIYRGLNRSELFRSLKKKLVKFDDPQVKPF